MIFAPRYRRPGQAAAPPIGLAERFGFTSLRRLAADLAEVARDGLGGTRFQLDSGSPGLLRADLALPAYAGLVPRDGLAPIYNLFDRVGGGRRYSQRVSRGPCRDFRGGRLTYDEHDGTDFVCPVGTPLVAAAPGTVVMIRSRWLRGGLTVAVDHGQGVVSQYTHCSRVTVQLAQPVQRGEEVALSGAAGYDLVQFFPLVPPHIHFMVFVHGRPVDPFLAAGGLRRTGQWLAGPGSLPAPATPLQLEGAAPIPTSGVDQRQLERLADACTDPTIQRELEQVRDDSAALAALLEDALCHDRWAFPAALGETCLRPPPALGDDRVELSLPLPASIYRGSTFADCGWTAP
jgi:murein DD-endopeptidase MepM/ murein hydrolase activator NlpD